MAVEPHRCGEHGEVCRDMRISGSSTQIKFDRVSPNAHRRSSADLSTFFRGERIQRGPQASRSRMARTRRVRGHVCARCGFSRTRCLPAMRPAHVCARSQRHARRPPPAAGGGTLTARSRRGPAEKDAHARGGGRGPRQEAGAAHVCVPARQARGAPRALHSAHAPAAMPVSARLRANGLPAQAPCSSRHGSTPKHTHTPTTTHPATPRVFCPSPAAPAVAAVAARG